MGLNKSVWLGDLKDGQRWANMEALDISKPITLENLPSFQFYIHYITYYNENWGESSGKITLNQI